MEHYCKSPWMSLFVYNDGKVKSCCAGSFDWGDLKENSLQEIIQSPKVKKLRKDIAEGRHNSYCDVCKECEERVGKSSRDYYEKFKMTEEELLNPDLFDLRMVDMRWNNLCNLNCVYCSSIFSTTWQKVKGEIIPDLRTNHYVTVLNEVNNNASKMEAIIMGGGEPLLHTMNVELLQSLPSDIHIDVMTNLSTNLGHSEVFQALKNKTRVNWAVSMENIGEQFEFVRHGADWNKMYNNLKTITKIPGHFKLLHPTYNILSATNLIKLYTLIAELDLDVHWQGLINPAELDVFNFSPNVLDYCIQCIDELFNSDVFKKHITATRFINNPEFLTDKDFLTFTRTELEKKKQQSYNYIDKDFRVWITNYNLKYAADVKSFEELWPELNSRIL